MKRGLALLALLVACSAARPGRYETAESAAHKAYAAGRYAEAAEHWQNAAKHADSARDRQEAMYRAAASYQRGGRLDQAAELYRGLSSQTGDRAARAALARADIEEERGDEAVSQKLYLDTAKRFANSGPGDTAARKHLRWVERTRGKPAALALATELVAELGGSELDERLRYERARLLEDLGQAAAARDAYLECARRHPYPKGALWDDALWRAALCEERLGNGQAAIRVLEGMLREREQAHVTGSYERGRYDDARYKVAELYRDALKDNARARKEFRRVWDEHPTSLLRDDALFEEAQLAKAQGDEAAACNALRLLIEKAPDSRYAPCAPLLCPALPENKERRCRDYVQRSIQGPATAEP